MVILDVEMPRMNGFEMLEKLPAVSFHLNFTTGYDQHALILSSENSYLVNLNEVEKYIKGEGGYLMMSDGNNIDVSKQRKETLLQKLQPFKS